MIIYLLLLSTLPGVYWDQGVKGAQVVRAGAIERIYVPHCQKLEWDKEGVRVEVFNANGWLNVPTPGVVCDESDQEETISTRIEANGWRFERNGNGKYFYDNVPWRRATLAAAEAYAYGVDALIHPDAGDLVALGSMLEFLRRIDEPVMPPLVNIGVLEDGSPEAEKMLKMLARHNLLFRILPEPDQKYNLMVQIGTEEYPKSMATDPVRFTALIREKLADEKRLLRLYGSEVVLARLAGNKVKARVHLLNYGLGVVNGLRVRVRGTYPHASLAGFAVEGARLMDYTLVEGVTEFTIPELREYAVVDLTK